MGSKKIENLEITNITLYKNFCYEGVRISWTANIGFGVCELYRERDSDKCCADTEHMCDSENRKFLKMLLDKLADTVEVTG